MNKLTFVSGVLALSFLSVSSMANAEKLTPHETFRLETESGTNPNLFCRYRPVIDGVEMQWFDGIISVEKSDNIRSYKCFTRNHGEIGERHQFNNRYLGGGLTTYGPFSTAEYEKAMSHIRQ